MKVSQDAKNFLKQFRALVSLAEELADTAVVERQCEELRDELSKLQLEVGKARKAVEAEEAKRKKVADKTAALQVSYDDMLAEAQEKAAAIVAEAEEAVAAMKNDAQEKVGKLRDAMGREQEAHEEWVKAAKIERDKLDADLSTMRGALSELKARFQ